MSSSIRRAGLTIFFGSAGGMAVTMALAPVISRLYSPTQFGVYSTILAVASTMIGAASMRLEILAQSHSAVSRQIALVKLAIITVTVVSIAVSVIAAIVVALTGLSFMWVLAGPMVWIGSAPGIGTATLVLDQKYKAVAAQNFLLHAGTSGFQALAGTAVGGPAGLVFGFIAGRFTWLPRIFFWARQHHDGLGKSWRETRGDAMAAGGSALVNSSAGQVLPILLLVTHGASAAGLVAMALRVAISPINVVGQAISSAAAGEVGSAVRTGDLTLAKEKIQQGMKDQARLAAPILIALGVAAPFFSGVVLGEEWSRAGVAISLLCIGGYAQFIVAPFSQVMNLTGNSVQLLKWDVLRLIAFSCALLLPYFFGLGWEYSLGAYSLAQVPLYILLAHAISRATDSAELVSENNDPGRKVLDS